MLEINIRSCTWCAFGNRLRNAVGAQEQKSMKVLQPDFEFQSSRSPTKHKRKPLLMFRLIFMLPLVCTFSLRYWMSQSIQLVLSHKDPGWYRTWMASHWMKLFELWSHSFGHKIVCLRMQQRSNPRRWLVHLLSVSERLSASKWRTCRHPHRWHLWIYLLLTTCDAFKLMWCHTCAW